MKKDEKMTDSSPRVTALLNNYNYGQFLPEAIDAVIHQTYKNLEIVIVDDGSTDQSVEIIQRYAAQDSRIVPVLKENGGQASSFNAGVAASTGDIICFLDSDDLWVPQKVETIVEAHVQHAFVQHDVMWHGIPRFTSEGFRFDRTRLAREYGYYYLFSVSSAISLHRSLTNRIFPIPEKELQICADIFVMMASVYFEEMCTLPEVLGEYRIHARNECDKHQKRFNDGTLMYDHVLEVVNRWLFERGHPPLPVHTHLMQKRFRRHVLGIEPDAAGYIYGTGSMSEEISDIIDEAQSDLRGYIDSNPQRIGTLFRGKPVSDARQVRNQLRDQDVIWIGTSFSQPVIEELKQAGIEPSRIRSIPVFHSQPRKNVLCGSPEAVQSVRPRWPTSYFAALCRCGLGEAPPSTKDEQHRPSLEEDYRKVDATEHTHSPLASIICVTYNHEAFIRDAIHGFLMQQTSFPFEIIIHDDASSDGTVEILEEQARLHPDKFVLILRNRNIHSNGQSATYHALKHARGRYVALCEGDDFWTDANKLERQVAFMESHPDFSACYHSFYPCTVRGKIGYALPHSLKNPVTPAHRLKKKPIYMTTATLLFRNIPDLLSPEMHLTKFRDNFICAMLGNHGKAMYLDGISPSGYRLHRAGIFSLTPDTQKKMDRITTGFWIAEAFGNRFAEKSAAQYWRYRAAQILARTNGSFRAEVMTGLRIAGSALLRFAQAPCRRAVGSARYGMARLSGVQRPKAIIFGASKGGANAYRNLRHAYDVVAFTDNDTKKHGTQCCGRKIICPDDICEIEFDYILVASTYRWHILEQLQRQCSISVDKIMVVPPDLVIA